MRESSQRAENVMHTMQTLQRLQDFVRPDWSLWATNLGAVDLKSDSVHASSLIISRNVPGRLLWVD